MLKRNKPATRVKVYGIQYKTKNCLSALSLTVLSSEIGLLLKLGMLARLAGQ